MRRHPSRIELLTYAEALADGAAIPAHIARHMASCPECSHEAKSIRNGLMFVSGAPALEPTAASTTQILSMARRERRASRRTQGVGRALAGVAKGLACAAALVVLSVASFRSALGHQTPREDLAPAAAVARAEQPSPEEVQRANADIERLAAAVNTPDASPRSLEEWQYRRRVVALDADLTAARAALESNPGCERARRVVNTNLKQQAEALRALYVTRSL